MRLIALMFVFVSNIVQAAIEAPELSDREYRSLILPNSLKVLLISDPTTDKAAASMDVYVGTIMILRDSQVLHISSNTCCF